MPRAPMARIAGLLLLLIPAWVALVAPSLTKIPSDFHYEADVFSLDDFYDAEHGQFQGEGISRTRFFYDAVPSRNGALLVKNVFDVRKYSGEKIFSVERTYGVDPRTGRHLPGFGDHDRDGYLFAPRWVWKSPFTYWHINYDVPARMTYQGSEDILGLTVNRFACAYHADQTKDLGFLPGVGKTRGVRLDIDLELWIEPVSGHLVKYEDHTLAYFYDLKTGERLHPWNRFHNSYTQASIAEHALLARRERTLVVWVDVVVPLLLLLAAAFFLVPAPSTLFSRTGAALKDLLRAPAGEAPSRVTLWTGVTLGLLVLCTWQALSRHEDASVEQALESEKARLKIHIAAQMDERIQSLVRLAQRWETGGEAEHDYWRKDSANHIVDYQGFQAIEWVDASDTVRWVEPKAGNAAVLGEDLAREPRHREALAEARRDSQVVVTRALGLKQGGGTGFLIVVPLHSHGRFDGYILGVYRYEKLMDALLYDAVAEGHNLALFDGDEKVYDRGPGKQASDRWTQRTEIHFQGTTWRLVLSPHPAWIARSRSILPEVVLVLGLFLTALIVLCLRLAHEAERQTRILEETSLQLTRSNKDLEQFASVASHDLQEPLRVVASYIALLAGRYKDKLDADGEEFIAHAVDGVTRMQELIRHLLAYSRISKERMFHPIDSGVALERALANLAAAVRESGATVTHGPLPRLTANPPQFTQLLQNLVGNAIKYRGSAPPEIRIEAARADGAWLFSVRDNGIGFEMVFAERIFELFQRLHSRAEYPGTGIGLAYCKKIVEQHGGRIWAESAPGKGSTFYFTISDALRS